MGGVGCAGKGAAAPAEGWPLPGPASGRVLLVEDDSLERRRVGAELEAAGYAVTLASSGDEGLALLRDGRYDAVVLDIVMPGMSGLDVCARPAPTSASPASPSCCPPST